ncbi:MAG: calcium-translocating P-type ATPase, PMCA-type [Candidatus Aenigmarchaeota archaeon]|nr:calcium-translocating P-type ATPase, PMCA-type [Candidatus Aenigmarchaeota archaeon]
MEWHSKDVDEVFKFLKTSKDGLTQEEAKKRLLEYGKNVIVKKRRVDPFKIFVRQFTNFLVLILIFAASVSFLIKSELEAVVILAVVILNVSLGFFQEYRAEKALEALEKLTTPKAKVLRNGKLEFLNSEEIVPGDVIYVEEGDVIPADIRLFEAMNLKVNEAVLTGESVPSLKFTHKLPEKTPLGDRENMGYSATTVTYGRGKGVVVATGMKTEFGKIAKSIQQIREEPTPLTLKLRSLGRLIGVIVLFLSIIIFSFEWIVTKEVYESFMIAIALAVSAVPEGLPTIVTVCLALGVKRMASRNAIVRKLASVETLGCVTVICSDKTGTLTKGEMTVKKIFVNDKILEVTGSGYEPVGKILESGKEVKESKELSLLLEIAALCNHATLKKDKEWYVVGDPTEGSLLVAAAKFGIRKEEIEKKYPILAEIPFSSERKMMSTIHKVEDKYFMYTKGAHEVIVNKSKFILKNSKVKRFSKKEKEKILKIAEEFAAQAFRVLAFGYRELSDIKKVDNSLEEGLTFVGFVGIIDPPRPEVREAVEKCKQAGIRVIMITGDHELTAVAIAKEIGMDSEKFITGIELDELDEKELEKIVEEVSIYARTSVEHKEKILDVLRKKGHVVAMTGDGVNDAPAVKRADIGIAMGIKGSDVTREASDMVLADDNFATIVKAIEEGRGIYDNIRKFVRFLLSVNFAEIFLVLSAIILSVVGLIEKTILPLLPLQILWINLLTDGLPALALSVDPYDPEVMMRKPRSKKEGILHRLLPIILAASILSLLLYLGIFIFGLKMFGTDEFGITKTRTMIFTFIVFFELFFVFNCRSEKHSVFKLGIMGNKKLIIAVIISAVLQIMVVYVPFFQVIFSTVPLTLFELLLIISLSASALLILPEVFIK